MDGVKREWSLQILAGSLTVVDSQGVRDSSPCTLSARFLGFPPLLFEGTASSRKVSFVVASIMASFTDSAASFDLCLLCYLSFFTPFSFSRRKAANQSGLMQAKNARSRCVCSSFKAVLIAMCVYQHEGCFCSFSFISGCETNVFFFFLLPFPFTDGWGKDCRPTCNASDSY